MGMAAPGGVRRIKGLGEPMKRFACVFGSFWMLTTGVGAQSLPEEFSLEQNGGQARSVEHSQAISRDAIAPSIAGSSDNLRFAASVAGFGQLLRGGTFTGQWSYGDALALARNARGADPHGYRGEFVHLIELAQSLSSGS